MCLLVPGLLIYCSRRGLAVYNGYVLSQFTRHFPDGLILIHITFVLGAERPCSIAIRTYYVVRKRGIPAALGGRHVFGFSAASPLGVLRICIWQPGCHKQDRNFSRSAVGTPNSYFRRVLSTANSVFPGYWRFTKVR